jgi:outer membrane cobalamin receptor
VVAVSLALEETSPLFFGNPKLEPEYAATFDVGAFDGDSSLTYFGSRASNLIVSTPPLFIPENVSAANIRGIAATFAVPLDFSDRLDFNYTDYLRADDLTNGARLPYRPTATGSVRWSRSASRGFAFGATLDYVGRRFADDPNTVLAAQYASVGAFLSHAFGARTKVTVRVNDLTGERVEDVPGYPVLGSTVSASVSTSW